MFHGFKSYLHNSGRKNRMNNAKKVGGLIENRYDTTIIATPIHPFVRPTPTTMVFFSCDGCGESLKKSQVDSHARRCRQCASVSCLDCLVSFYGGTTTTDTHLSRRTTTLPMK